MLVFMVLTMNRTNCCNAKNLKKLFNRKKRMIFSSAAVEFCISFYPYESKIEGYELW